MAGHIVGDRVSDADNRSRKVFVVPASRSEERSSQIAAESFVTIRCEPRVDASKRTEATVVGIGHPASFAAIGPPISTGGPESAYYPALLYDTAAAEPLPDHETEPRQSRRRSHRDAAWLRPSKR